MLAPEISKGEQLVLKSSYLALGSSKMPHFLWIPRSKNHLPVTGWGIFRFTQLLTNLYGNLGTLQ